jgi:hypothetical protein
MDCDDSLRRGIFLMQTLLKNLFDPMPAAGILKEGEII